MSQYLQFRSWMRSSSAAEKKLATAASFLSLGLVAWALVPTGGPHGQSVATSGGSAGVSSTLPNATGGSLSSGSVGGTGSLGSSTGAGRAGVTVPSGGSSSVSSGAGGGGGSAGATSSGAGSTGRARTASAGSSASSSSCGSLTSSDRGVSPTQIRVADVLLNLAGAIGNSAVGQASPQLQQQMAQAVVDDINSHGGVDCRKLVVTYYQANPIDPSSTQNICLEIQQAGVFAVIGGFAYPAAANDCLAQRQIPVVGNIAPTPSEARQYYPYLMSPSPDPVTDYANAILGMKSRGYFSAGKGFSKVAILEDDCSPEVNQAVYSYLTQAGVRSSQITKNEFSCPSGGFASPSDMSQFATQDNLAHVTNVVVVTGGGSFEEFTKAAKGQNFKPKYLVSNYDGFMVTATGATGPDPGNFDGTVVTTDTRFGEANTPGLTDPGTQACIALFARHGLPASDITGSYIGGVDCNLFGLFAAAASHDAGPTRAGLAAGLAQVGRFNEAYPSQDSIYRAPGITTPVKMAGGDFWWTVQFHASCTCFMVIDRTEHPSYR